MQSIAQLLHGMYVDIRDKQTSRSVEYEMLIKR